MGLISNLVDGFRVKNNDEDEEYFLDDDYIDEDDRYAEEAEEPRQNIFRRMNQPKRNSVEEDEPKPNGFFKRNKVMPVQASNMEVVMKCPKEIKDSIEICDALLEGKAVLINLEGIDGGTAQRIIDFIHGSTYSIEGDLKKVSTYICIASPHSVELSGDFKGEYSKAYMNQKASSRAINSGYSYNV